MPDFAVPCLFGLEGLVGDELRRLGLEDVRAETGRVLCRGTLADIPRLNLNLRCGERVLLLLGQFPARSFEALFQAVRDVAWEDFIPRDGQFPVKGHALSSQLHSVPDCQKIVKKAAAERLGRVYGLERLPETGEKYQIQFRHPPRPVQPVPWTPPGRGSTSGATGRWGWRPPCGRPWPPPWSPSAAYRGRDPFRDPFCGSGTIAIEAALIAKNRAPGLDRSFDAQRWKCLPSRLWVDAAGEAMDKEFDGAYDIWGGDIDPRAVSIAQSNAVKAGVEDEWSASNGRTCGPSAVRESTARSSPTRPTASGWGRRRRRRPCTGPLARSTGTCPPSGGCWSSPATRSSSGSSAAGPIKSGRSTTGCSSVSFINSAGSDIFRGLRPRTSFILFHSVGPSAPDPEVLFSREKSTQKHAREEKPFRWGFSPVTPSSATTQRGQCPLWNPPHR